MIEGRAETMEEWYTIINETVDKYTILKEKLTTALVNQDEETIKKYKPILDSYNDILKMYSYYLK